MSDLAIRVAVVAAAILLILGYSMIKSRNPKAGRAIANTGLAPGVYLFSSKTCHECDGARGLLTGSDFHEISWEDQPEEFERLGIGEVPSTLVVGSRGAATLHRGVPNQVRDNP